MHACFIKTITTFSHKQLKVTDLAHQPSLQISCNPSCYGTIHINITVKNAKNSNSIYILQGTVL